MKKVKRLLLVLSMFMLTVPNLVFADLEYIKCGSAEGIPKPLPQMTTILYTIFIVATPIILIGTSIFTMTKALSAKDEEEINKAKKKIIKKFIIAAIIILLGAIVRFTIGQVVTNDEDMSTVKSCMKCFMFYAEETGVCEPSDTGNDVKRGFYHTEPDSTFINDTASNRSNMADRYSSNGPNSNQNMGNLGSKTILLGDSRGVGLCGFSDSYANNSATCRDWWGVARGGMGYRWMVDTGVSLVNSKLSSDSGTRYNILNWLGVNDLGSSGMYPNQPETMSKMYGDKMIELANGDWKNQNVIMVSVTDIGVENTGGAWPVDRTNIRSFNEKLKARIESAGLANLHYCDIGSLDLAGGLWPDNLHYNSEGNNKIYAAMQSTCLKSSS